MAGKTFSQKPADIARRWILIDARDASLGRLSTAIASYLTGKYKPTYTPHVDNGDYVIVVNASELVVTGDKETDKILQLQRFPRWFERSSAQRSPRQKPGKYH